MSNLILICTSHTQKQRRLSGVGGAYFIGAVREVHANDIETGFVMLEYRESGGYLQRSPLRSMLIFSTEFVLGPVGKNQSAWREFFVTRHPMPL